MKSLYFKDNKHRYLTFKYHNFRFILKNIVTNKNFKVTFRLNAMLKLINLSSVGASTKCLNRCIFTNRKKGINKSFKLSRLALLKIVRSSSLYGVKKFVW